MIKKSLSIAVVIIALCSLANGFEIQDSNKFVIDWNKQPLILQEFVTYPNSIYWDNFATETQETKLSDDVVSYNRWSVNSDFASRRELVYDAKNKEIEISFIGEAPAYKENVSSSVDYGFELDLKAFDGAKFEAVYDRTAKSKRTSGEISLDMPDGYVGPSTGVRVLVVTTKENKNIVFDFNPEGVVSYSDFGPTNIQGIWKIQKKGDKLRFYVGFTRKDFGGALCSKASIYLGDYQSWENRHAQFSYTYYGETPVQKSFAFGDNKIGKLYTAANKKYDENQKFGWLNDTPKAINIAPSGALYSAVTLEKENIFKVNDLRDGLYLLNITFNGLQTAGDMGLELNGEKINSSIKTEKGFVTLFSAPVWLENSECELKFLNSGELSTISLQLIINTKEDFKLRRAFWRTPNLFEPSILEQTKYYAKTPEYKQLIESVKLPEHNFKVPENYVLNLEKEVLLPENNDAMDWRYTATIGSLGPGNNGTFNEFKDPKDLERRFQELKAEGKKVIIVNGFLSRHTYEEHKPRVKERLKAIVDMAHKYGIKIIDHQDLTILWHMGESSTRQIISNTDKLLRSVDERVATRGFCLNNPTFKKGFYDEIKELVEYTNIDGFMLDEVSFFDPKFCGCKYCREKFTEETNLTLPMDETNPDLFNKKSTLWKAYQAFRINSTVDFLIGLRKVIQPVKKDFSLMKYSTHYGWYSTYATLRQGHSLAEDARVCDFLGTEVMSRNVIVSRRPVFAFRKMKSAINYSFDMPIFSLIYPANNYDTAYFGWAMNNMANQVTWEIQPTPKTSGKSFTAFTGVNDKKNSKIRSNLAILFSTSSKDYANDFDYHRESLGFSELLSDLNISNEFILEEALNEKDLKPFDTLLVLNACNLSDPQIEAIRKFAFDGGTVVLSSNVALYDSLGTPRKSWAFEDIFAFAPVMPFSRTTTNEIVYKGESLSIPKMDLPKMQINHFLDYKPIIAYKNSVPLLSTANYGKGKMIYSALQLGSFLVEKEQTTTQKYAWNPDKTVLKMTKDILKELFLENSTLKPIQIPEGLLSSIYTDEKSNQIIIHLLNGCGINVALHQTITAENQDGIWTPISEDIIFEVKDAQAKNVYALSPDYDDKKSIKFENLPNNRVKIIITPEDLKKYSIIYIRRL